MICYASEAYNVKSYKLTADLYLFESKNIQLTKNIFGKKKFHQKFMNWI